MKKIQNNEWTQNDMNIYMQEDFAAMKHKKKEGPSLSEYDTDLDRTMYKEFWTDLAEFKPKGAKKTFE